MIIETSNELDYCLTQLKESDVFLFPIYVNNKRHPANNMISLLYAYSLNKQQDFIFVFNHGETHQDVYSLDILDKLNDNRIFTFDKKMLLHSFNLKNVCDVNLLNYLSTNNPLSIDSYKTRTHDMFERMYYDRDDVNKIIPILKHLEFCRKVKDFSLDIINKNQHVLSSNVYKNYNEKLLNNFYSIEKSGLYVDFGLFNQFFKDKQDNHLNDSFLYTNYNVFTSTSRPSNSFGGINFAALKKDSGERGMLKSRFKCDGLLVEFDYDAFHIRLIADIINFKFPENVNVHEYLGKQYFDKDTLTKEEYEESKNLTFKQLYGGIFKEFKSISFFKEVDEYIYNIWNIFETDGYIKSKLFGRKIRKTDSNFNRQKLLNYVIQNYETEFNSLMIEKILEKISSYKSDIILYTYDSILFDMHLTDGKEFIKEIQQIMEVDGKFPVKIKYGTNFHDMKDLRK